MKIALNLLYIVPNKVGGTQTYAEGILKEINNIKKKDLEIHIFCSKPYYEIIKKHNYKFIYHVIPIVHLSKLLRVLFENMMLPLVVYFNKIKLVHSLGYTCPILLPCKNIVTIHDLNWYHHPENFTFFNRIIWKLLVTTSAKNSDLIITDSFASKNTIVKILKIKAKKIRVIYPGINQKKITTNKTYRKKFKITKPYIFTVSSMHPHKNLMTLLEAFKMINDDGKKFQLVISGLGGSDEEIILNYIKTNFKRNEVVLTGWVSKEEMHYLYSDAKLFIFVSLYEGFGFPVLEAFLYKVPVVSSKSYSLAEVLGNGAVIIDPLSRDDIFRKTIDVIYNKNKMNSLVKRGLIIVKKFNWKTSVESLISTYLNI